MIAELDTFSRREHRVFAHLYSSYQQNSIREGYKHSKAILRPDLMIKQLIKAGLLPEKCEVGRLDMAGSSHLKRTAIDVQLAFISEREEEIKMYLEDNTEWNPDEGFNVLCAGVLLSGLSGRMKMASKTLSRISARLLALPASRDRNRVLSNPDYMYSLVSAA